MSDHVQEREALVRLREGTEILRTGGGTTLTAAHCNAILDRLEAASKLTEQLEKIESAASPREWETPGHPMNGWTRREPILRLVREALAASPGEPE